MRNDERLPNQANNGEGVLIGKLPTPTEFVDFPSEGRYYLSNSSLYNCKDIEIKLMGTAEEDILTNRSLLKKGIAIERLLSQIIVDKSVKVDDLLLGDKNAILVAARKSGLGNDYRAKIACEFCGAVWEEVFDLEKICETYKGIIPEGVEVIENMFYVTLPHSKHKIGFTLLTSADERYLTEAAEMRKQKKLPEANTTLMLSKIIKLVDDTPMKEPSFPMKDSKYLANIYQDICPNIRLISKITCSKCEEESEVNVPITAEFFWPRR